MYYSLQFALKMSIMEVRNVFEIKKNETANKTFRLPVELIKRLEMIAQQEDISVNNLVLQCCEYALDNRPKNDVGKETSTLK